MTTFNVTVTASQNCIDVERLYSIDAESKWDACLVGTKTFRKDLVKFLDFDTVVEAVARVDRSKI